MRFASPRFVIALVLFASALQSLPLLAQPAPLVLTLRGSASIGDSGIGTDIQVMDGFAYIAWLQFGANPSGGLQIFGVTNSSNPAPVGGYNGREPVNAVHVVGRYAYLAEGSARTLTNDPGALEIIDVNDPANPVRVGGIDTRGRALAVQVVANYAYVAESTRWTGSNLLGALEIFDVSNPANPQRLSTHDTGGTATALEVFDGYVYLADGVTDLQVVDVRDPTNPGRVGGFDFDERTEGAEFGGPALYIQRLGNFIYSANASGLHILDVSTAASPVRVSGNSNWIFPYAFHVSERYFIESVYGSFANRFFLVIAEVNNGTNPTRVTFSDALDWVRSIHAVGRTVYAVGSHFRIHELMDIPVIRSLSCTGGTLILTWDDVPGFTLQSTASLADPDWREVPGSSGQTQIELSLGGSEFFRLFKPPWNE